MFGSMGLCYIPLCSGASVGITKAAMVHQHYLSSHRTARNRRDLVSPLVSPLEPQSEGFIGTFPESCGRGDLLAFMRLGYISLCSRASVGIAKAALVHEDDLCSHRTERERPRHDRSVTTSLALLLKARLPSPPSRAGRAIIWLHGRCLHPPLHWRVRAHHERRASA